MPDDRQSADENSSKLGMEIEADEHAEKAADSQEQTLLDDTPLNEGALHGDIPLDEALSPEEAPFEATETESVAQTDAVEPADYAAASPLPKEVSLKPIWFEQPIPGNNKLSFSEALEVEWRLLDQHEGSRTEAKLVTLAGASALSVHTSPHARWSRLSASSGQHGTEIVIAAQILLQIESYEDPEACWIEPMMARRTKASATRKEGLEDTRVRLSLPVGCWVLVSGLFFMPTPDEDVSYDVLLHLAEGCKARIARVDVDVLENIGSRLDTSDVDVLYPFSARVVDVPPRRIPANIMAGADGLISRLASALAGCSRDPSVLGAELLLRNQEPGFAILVQAYVDWAGYNVAIANPDIDPAYFPDPALLNALLRLHIDALPGLDLNERDRMALKMIESLADSNGAIKLTSPRPLRIRHWGAEVSEDDDVYWSKLLSHGLSLDTGADEAPGGQVLEIMPSARLSSLAIAIMRSTEATQAGLDIRARIKEADDRRWTGKIVGFPEEGHQTDVGTLSRLSSAAGTVPVGLIAEMHSIAPTTVGRVGNVAIETCYAFVLNLGVSSETLGMLDNIENCIVCDSPAELQTILKGATASQLAKPVILLHAGLQDNETYIPQAVARHWSLGGRYALTSIRNSYTVETGEMKLERVDSDTILRFALTAALTSLPASQLQDLDPAVPIFIPSHGICIAYAGANLSDADVVRLERAYRPKDMSSENFEQLTLRSVVDGAYLDTIDLNVHWPLDKTVSKFRMLHLDLKDLIRTARRSPTEANVNALFSALTKKGVDIAYVLEDLLDFIRGTSGNSNLNLAIKPEHLVTYISYARRSPDADAIAIDLSTYADKICLRDVNLIFPLFELLASCLDQAQLSAVLAFCASRCARASDRYTFRVAECLRRYGDPATLALLLVNLYHDDRIKLQKRELLRSFEPLIRSDLRATVERQFGPALIDKIEGTVDMADRIESRIRGLDRAGVLELLNSSLSVARLDFFKWLDRLRALSNELREMAIPISAIASEGLDRQPKQLLAAAIFSDAEVIRYLCGLGLVDQVNDLNAVARNIAGDNVMLNGMIASSFANYDIPAYEIQGDSIYDVFDAASAMRASNGTSSGKRVTVVMSAFNPDIALMEQAVASVMNQSHRNLELIIIDDASEAVFAAQIATIVRRYDNCSLIRLDTNAGPYIGRNLAIQQATGDYIAIHDADDWAHPDRLKAQVALLEEDPNARLLTAYHIRVDRAGHIQFEADFSIYGDGPMTSMFKREVFDEIGAFAHVRSRGDVEMRERIRGYYGHHAIVTLPLPLLLCLADTSTLSQQTKTNNLEYLQLFRTNISRRSPLGTFRRKEAPLTAANQILVPRRLRAAMPAKEPMQ